MARTKGSGGRPPTEEPAKASPATVERIGLGTLLEAEAEVELAQAAAEAATSFGLLPPMPWEGRSSRMGAHARATDPVRAASLLGSRWLDPFASTLQHSRLWMREVSVALGVDDPRAALLALRTVLGTLRDQLTTAEVADLGAQLPMLLRGLWLDGWRGHPDRVSSRAEFLARVAERIGPESPIEAENAVRAVCVTLRRHVSSGEMHDVIGVLPDALKELVRAE